MQLSFKVYIASIVLRVLIALRAIIAQKFFNTQNYFYCFHIKDFVLFPIKFSARRAFFVQSACLDWKLSRLYECLSVSRAFIAPRTNNARSELFL